MDSILFVNPLSATPQNGQTHSNSLSAVAISRQRLTNCLSVSDRFVGFALKGLKLENLSNTRF